MKKPDEHTYMLIRGQGRAYGTSIDVEIFKLSDRVDYADRMASCACKLCLPRRDDDPRFVGFESPVVQL